MASVLGKDRETYKKEKECFMKELHQFHQTRGTPFKHGPRLNGKKIDLYLLYTLVIEKGGWLNGKNNWDKIIKDLRLPKSCVNISVAIKQIYLRYLDRYEKVHFLGEVGDRLTEEDEDSRHRKWSMRSLHSVPLTYNHTQHYISESLREYNGFSVDLYKPSEFDKLGLSLISPLANEQDFAINVCTVMSYDPNNILKLEKHPRILNYLLAHAAVFSHRTLSTVFCEHYSKSRGHSLSHFWEDVLCEPSLSHLVYENYEEKPNWRSDNPLFTITPEDKQLFCLGRTLGTQEFVGQRVLQIASILRNLSFIPENINLMSNHDTFIRFVVLCCGSQWNALRQIGWDILGNLGADITIQRPLMPDILFLTVQGLASMDRARLLSSLEVLNKLSQNTLNEDYLLKSLELKVYRRVCSLLTIPDICLLIATLECLFGLSSLGEKACSNLLKVRGILSTLVSLLTLDAQCFGPDAYIQMKIVETTKGVSGEEQETVLPSMSKGNLNLPARLPSPPVQSLPVQTQTVNAMAIPPTSIPPLVPTSHIITQSSPQVHTTPQTTQHLSAPAQSQASQAQHYSTPPQTQVSQSQVQTVLSQAQVSQPQAHTGPPQAQVPLSQVSVSPQTPASPSLVQSGSPQSQAQSSTSQAQSSSSQAQRVVTWSSGANPSPQLVSQENELFALAWLKSGFEVKAGACIEQQEMYKLYINYCSKVGRRAVIAPHHFPRSVKGAFGINLVCGPSSSHDVGAQYYEGIQVRPKPLVSENTLCSLAQTPSPILKAQLSAPPKPTALCPQQIKEPSAAGAPTGDQATTSLIKSLLATKVTQRQQQQRLLQKSNETLYTVDHHFVTNNSCLAALIGANSSDKQPIDSSNIQAVPNKASTSRVASSQTSGKKEVEQSDNSTCSTPTTSTATSTSTDEITCVEDSLNVHTSKNVMLTDLLEKSVAVTEPPSLNGALRLGDKGLELVQENIGSSPDFVDVSSTIPIDAATTTSKGNKVGVKRSKESLEITDPKKPRLIDDIIKQETPEEGNVSSSAANLYAALAADAVEDESVEESVSEPPVVVAAANQPRQILVTTGAQLAQQVVLNGQQYVITQPQNSLLQGHAQTVLLAQAGQTHCSPPKTIIILQPQNVGSASAQQKVILPNFAAGPPPLIRSSSPIRSKSPPKSATPIIIQQGKIHQNIAKALPNSIFSNTTHTTGPGSTVIMSGVSPPCATPIGTSVQLPVIGPANPNTSTQRQTSENQQAAKRPDKGNIVCEWKGCMRSFKSNNELYLHACEAHCPTSSVETQCMWERCDSVRRKRLSLMTHLHDRHCSGDRKQGPVRVEGGNQCQAGFVANAAFHALKRHSLEYINAKEQPEEQESAVTKSIRLTAALILRNIVLYTTNGRSVLTGLEADLANVALSGVEASRTIAQVLFDMSQPQH